MQRQPATSPTHGPRAIGLARVDHRSSRRLHLVDDYQRNQTSIANNAVTRGDAVRGAIRSGPALLVGLLRCGTADGNFRSSISAGTHRYACMTSRLDADGVCCVRTNWLQTDAVIAEGVLRCLAPLGIEATLAASRGGKRKRMTGSSRSILRLSKRGTRRLVRGNSMMRSIRPIGSLPLSWSGGGT